MSQEENAGRVSIPLQRELGWPLNINKGRDKFLFEQGLAHWSCTTKNSAKYFIRRDGVVYVATLNNDGGFPSELRSIDIEKPIEKFIF